MASKKKPVKSKPKPARKAAPRKPKPAARKPRKPAGYEAHRARMAARSREAAKIGRDVGAIPDIVNVRRRAKCRDSLKLFCETYNPDAFNLAWSADHLKVISRIEESLQLGLLFALAMPRGSGKTAICRMAALWAVSYARARYTFVIGANSDKAEDTLSAIKTFIRFLPYYGEDFPEIAWPAQALGGIANRASGQLCQGESTLITWGQSDVVLPTVPPPANWPKSWPLRTDGKVPSSGCVLSASGLSGDGIRGSLKTLPTGELLRPDFVLLDDPQTNESAHSKTQNQTREQLVGADVLGMAGPGKSIAAVMPCTVIAQNDFVDRILDRAKHPLWRGERMRLLRSMPSDMAAWDPYLDLYRQCAQREPPDFAEATAYYRAHLAALEAGAEASWQARKLPSEISAIQHAMHLYARGRAAFFSEFQNDPLPLIPPLPGDLTAGEISARVNHQARTLVPVGSNLATAFIDVQQDLLFWMVCAWEEGFTGAAVDYGTWPPQQREYFTLADARPTLSDATGIGSLEGSIFAGLTKLSLQLLGRDWAIVGGGVLRIDRCLVDSGWGQSTEVVKRFCRQSAHAAQLWPSKGYGIGAGGAPMSDWAKKPGERRGLNWIQPAVKRGEGRAVIFDANFWKSMVHGRLATPLGQVGALTLFGDQPDLHRMLADHLTAEYRVRTSGRGRELDEWKHRPHRPDNHLFDCLVGCAVAASMGGAAIAEAAPVPAKPPSQTGRADYEAQRRAFEQRRGF